MLARYLNAPLLLLIWQVAPVDLKRDDHGRVKISFGAGGGKYTFRDAPGYAPGVDCTGEAYEGRDPYTEADTYTSVGGSAEAWATKTIRLLAAFGRVTDGSGERNGRFGGAQAVLERKDFGVGLGLAGFGGTRGALHPSASARVGSLEGLSLRADYYNPDAGMGLIGGPRVGVGLNQGNSLKPRLFAGMATTPVPDSVRRAGGFIEFAVPLRLFDVRTGLSLSAFISGTRGGNEEKRILAVGVGGWVSP